MAVRFSKKRERWFVDVTLDVPGEGHRRVRQDSPINTRKAAMEHERRLIESLLSSSAPANKEVTFQEFAAKFMESYVAANNKYSEIVSKSSMLEHHLIPAFGTGPLDPGAEKIEAYKAAKVASGLAPKSVNNQLACLSRMLTLAVEWGYLDKASRVRKLKTPPRKMDFLTFDEGERLMAAARGDAKAMIVLALHTGLRFGELLALRWEDVDLVSKALRVERTWWRGRIGTPKSGRSRIVPLTERVLAALKEHRHLRSELVFSRLDGKVMSRTIAWRVLQRACRRAGLRQIGWHVTRRSFASQLVMRGVPLRVVQEYLGHATIAQTLVYSSLAPSVTKDAIRVLDQPVDAILREDGGPRLRALP